MVEAAKQLQIGIVDLFIRNGFTSPAQPPAVAKLSLAIIPALVILVNSGFVQTVESLCDALPIVDHLWSSRSGPRFLYVALAMGALDLASSILRSFLAYFCSTIASWETTDRALRSEFLACLKRLQHYVSTFSSFPNLQFQQLAQIVSFCTSHCSADPALSFHMLCGFGFQESVRLLLDHGGACLINMLDHAKRSPLFFAACGGHLSVVKILLDEAASVYSDISVPPIIGLLRYFALAPHKPRYILRITGGLKRATGWDAHFAKNVLHSHIERSLSDGSISYSLAYQDLTASKELVSLLMPPPRSGWFKNQALDDKCSLIHPLVLIASTLEQAPHMGVLLEAILRESAAGCPLDSELYPNVFIRINEAYTLLDAAMMLAPPHNGTLASELFERLLIEYTPECCLREVLVAAEKGYWKLLQAAAPNTDRVNATVESYRLQALKLAVKQGRVDVVLALVSTITTEVVSNELLQVAVKANHLDIVSILLDNTPADPLSALKLAVRYSHKEGFELLMSALPDGTEALSGCIEKLVYVAVLNHSMSMIELLLALYQVLELVIGTDFADRSFSFWFQVLVNATKSSHEDIALQAVACIPDWRVKEVTNHRKYKDILYWSCYWGMADLLGCIPFTVDQLFERNGSSPWECAVANGHLGKLSFVEHFPCVPDNLADWLKDSSLVTSSLSKASVRLNFYNVLTTGAFHKVCTGNPPPPDKRHSRELGQFSFFRSQSLLVNAVVAGIPQSLQVVLEHLGRFAGYIVKLIDVPLVYIACSDGGNYEILELLLRALFEANVLDEALLIYSHQSSHRGYHALSWAVKNGAVKCVDALLRCSPPSVLQFKHPTTADRLLHLAVLSGEPQIVDMILKALGTGAPDSCFVANKNKEYPLYLAFALGHYKSAALLLKVATESTKWEEFYRGQIPKGTPNWRSTAKLAKGWFRALMEQPHPVNPTTDLELRDIEMSVRAYKRPQTLLISSVRAGHSPIVKALLTASCGYIIDHSFLLLSECVTDILLHAAVLESIAANKELVNALKDFDVTSLLCEGLGRGKSEEVILLLKMVNSSQLPLVVNVDKVLTEACTHNQFDAVQFLFNSHAFSQSSIKKALEVCGFASGALDLAAYIQLHTGVQLDERLLPPGVELSPVLRSIFIDDVSYYSVVEQLFSSITSSPGDRHPFAAAWLTHRWSPHQCKLVETKLGKAAAPGNPWEISVRNGDETQTVSVSIDWESFSEVLLGVERESPVPFPLFVEAIVFSPPVLPEICSPDNSGNLASLFGLDSAVDHLPSSVIVTCVCWPDEPSASSSTDGHGLLVLSYSPEDRTFIFPSSSATDLSLVEDDSGIQSFFNIPYSSFLPEHFLNLANYVSKSATTESGGKYSLTVELSEDFSRMTDSEVFTAVYPALRRILDDLCEVLKLTGKPSVLYSHLRNGSPKEQNIASLLKTEPVFSAVLARVSLQESEWKHVVEVSLTNSTLEIDLNVSPPDISDDEPPTISAYEYVLEKVTECLLAAELEAVKAKVSQLLTKDVGPRLQKSLKTSLVQADSSSVFLQDKLGKVHKFNELTVEHLILLKSLPRLRKFLFLFSRMLQVLAYKPRLLSSTRNLFETGFTVVVSESATTGFTLKAGVPQLTFDPYDAISGNPQSNLLGIFTSIIQAVSSMRRQSLESFTAGIPASFICHVDLEQSKGLLFPSLKDPGVITVKLVNYHGQCLTELPKTNTTLRVAIKAPSSSKKLTASSSDDPSPNSASEHLLVRAQRNGVFAIEWTPMEAGIHGLSVTINGVPIQGSPFKSFVPGLHKLGTVRSNSGEFGERHWAWSKGSNGSRHTSAGSSLVFIASHPKSHCSYHSPPPHIVIRSRMPIRPIKGVCSPQVENVTKASPLGSKAPSHPLASSHPLQAESASESTPADRLASESTPADRLAIVGSEERVHHVSVCSNRGIPSCYLGFHCWIHVPTDPLVVLVSRNSKVASRAGDKKKKCRSLQTCFQTHSLSLGNGLHRTAIMSSLAGTFKVFTACSICQAVMHVRWEDQTSVLPQSTYILPGPFCPYKSTVTVIKPSESGTLTRGRNSKEGEHFSLLSYQYYGQEPIIT